MAQVRLENVSKVYPGGIRAVDNLKLVVRDKEFMVIVGPSGCGKSTTLRIIAGLEEVTSGTVKIDDVVVNDKAPRDRDVAMVFQNYALYPHMTVYENISFGLKMRKVPPAELRHKVQQTAEMLGIQELLGRKPAELSGGQQQRVALGRAIVRNPQLFLLDEPLSNLDAELRRSTRVDLKSLHQQLRTSTIYVTHDQVEALSLGERICVMNNGTVQQVAPPMEIYSRPVNRFVAGFIGTPAMNFLPGHLEITGDKCRFAYGKGNMILLPTCLKDHLVKYNRQKVVLGIRPEHLSVVTGEVGPGQTLISGLVRLVELLGSRSEIHLELAGGYRWIVEIAGCGNLKVNVNDKVIIGLDSEYIHIFQEGENGGNITLSSMN